MTKKRLLEMMQTAGMVLAASVMLLSCSDIFGSSDNPVVTPEPTVENKNVEINATGAKITAQSASEATSLLGTLVDDIKSKGVGAGKEYVIEVAGDAIQASTDITLTVPRVVGANINLKFDKAFDKGTILNINASETSSDPTSSINTLAITLPSTDDNLILHVNMPETTVTLKSATGATTVYKEVVSRTAINTLIVDDSVMVNNVDVQGGTVQVNEGGILDSWTFAAETNGDQVIVREDGGIEPIKTANDQWLIASEDGNPYYARSLKIDKGDADYSIVWFGNLPDIPLKTVVVADGAVLQTNYIAMENIEGEGNGTGVIKYRLTSQPGFTDDSQYGGIKFYEWNSDISGVKNVKNITISQPELAPEDWVMSMVQDSIAKGYQMNEPRLNMDVDGNVDGCTFNYNHVFFCNTHSYECPTVTNCKFVHVDHGTELSAYNVRQVDNDIIEFLVPIVYDGNFDSNSITFENCDFSEGTKFWGYFRPDLDAETPEEWFDGNTHFTGYVNFKNCSIAGAKIDGSNHDFIKEIGAVSGTKVILKIDDEPKYEVVWDSENGGYAYNPIN